MVQLIASDMDGTLLDNNMVISPRNAAAIKQAQREGVPFVVSSGRAYSEIKPLLEAAQINCPMITMNGGRMFDEEGREIFAAPLPRMLADQLITRFHQAGLYIEVITEKGVFSDDKTQRIQNFAELLTRIHPGLPFKEAVIRSSARLELLNINYIDDYQELLDNPHTTFFKVVAFSSAGPTVLAPLKQELLAAHDNIAITSSAASNIEVNHINAQKGIAVSKYADMLNIPLDNVMAIGDNNNDVSMLKVAGISYAMQNGSAEVKHLARYIAAPNDQDGVGKAIEAELAKNNK